MTIQVSVVVPTHCRPQMLQRCLQALQDQSFDPAAFEIIVVDDEASAQTRRIVQNLKGGPGTGKSRPAIRYLPAPDTRGPAAARNLGWRAARGSIIAFTDDDCIPHSSWLCEGLAPFSHNGHVGVTGRVVVPLSPQPSDYELNQSHMEQSTFLTANCFYRRDALRAVGGFDERFTTAWREDSDLLFALLKQYQHPHRFVHAPQAIVYHPITRPPWGVSVRQQRKSMFNALLYKKHPDHYRLLIQARPPWHYYTMTGTMLLATVAFLRGRRQTGFVLTLTWLALVVRFCLRRLHGASHAPQHVLEMFVTSIVIPPVCIFWRLRGALKFRTFFL